MMGRFLPHIIGPAVPARELAARGARYRLPGAFFGLARLALLVSIFMPYWRMTLNAPQYPDGLHVAAYVNRIEGDVREIDTLNHYIGMRPLEEGGQLERSLSIAAIVSLLLLMEGAVLVHTRWAAVLALPSLIFPPFFLGDLAWWLGHFGRNLDPAAPLAGAIKPFTPPVLGTGSIGQFSTHGTLGPGFLLAAGATLLTITALYFHRRAYKPLVGRPGGEDGPSHAEVALDGAIAPRRRTAAAARRIATAPVVLGAAAAALLAAPGARGQFDLAAAIAKAPPRSTLEVPAGVYRGPVVIDRPLTLLARGEVILDGGEEGDVVEVNAPDVTIRGFVIRGTGDSLDLENAGVAVLAPRVTIEDNRLEDVLFGIYLKGSEHSVIRHNRIGGKDLAVPRRGDGIRIWESHGTVIEDNLVQHSRDVVIWFSDDVRLRGNRIRGGRYGLHFMYSDRNVIEDNQLDHNSVGAFLMYSHDLALRRNVFALNRGPSGYGVGLKDMDGTQAEDNLFIGNRVGLHLDNSPSSMHVHDTYTRNLFAANDVGVAFLPAVRRNRFTENVFRENIEQVAILGGGTFSGNDFTVDGRGNYWSDYRGYDLDGDGIGDLPYRAESLFENLMDREPKLRLFLYTPAQQAIDAAARALPIVRPRPKLTDTAPLMTAAPPVRGLARRSAKGPTLITALALLGLGALALLAGGRRFAPAPGASGGPP